MDKDKQERHSTGVTNRFETLAIYGEAEIGVERSGSRFKTAINFVSRHLLRNQQVSYCLFKQR